MKYEQTVRDILINIKEYATLHSLFYLETALHVSGANSTYHQERKQLCLQHLVFVILLLLPAAICGIAGTASYHHPSSGAQTSVSTASGICHTVTATCHYSSR